MSPPARDGVAVRVGGVALNAYEADTGEVMAMVRTTGPVVSRATEFDAVLAPPDEIACSRTLYSVPFVSPLMTRGLTVDAGDRVVQVAPSSTE